MNLLFMGTPDFAVPTLQALHQSSHTLSAVVTQPDRPKGRGQAVQFSPVKQYALDNGLDVLQPPKASDPDFIASLAQFQPDVIVVIAYGQILKQKLLDVPKHFCMNIHASLLPKYRGAAPINWAILNGDAETGVTTMKMDKGMDTGDMLLKREVPIARVDTAQTLHDALAEAGAALALETLTQLEAGQLVPVAQNHEEATHARKLTKDDGHIYWNQSAENIYNQIRGLDPWPGAYTFLNGKRLKCCKAETTTGSSGDAPGVVARVSDFGIEIGTRDGRLIVTEIQPEGKKRMTAKSFLAGHHVEIGDSLESSPHPLTPVS